MISFRSSNQRDIVRSDGVSIGFRNFSNSVDLNNICVDIISGGSSWEISSRISISLIFNFILRNCWIGAQNLRNHWSRQKYCYWNHLRDFSIKRREDTFREVTNKVQSVDKKSLPCSKSESMKPCLNWSLNFRCFNQISLLGNNQIYSSLMINDDGNIF